MTGNNRAECPNCKLPDQIVLLPCGYCNTIVPGNVEKPETIIGWRGWHVNNISSTRLWSPVFSLEWPPEGHRAGRWMVADCAKILEHSPNATDPDLVPPVKGCNHPGHGCGFYAARNRSHLIDLGYAAYDGHHTTVIGKVELAGKVIEATNGWRSELVRVKSIEVPYERWEVANALTANYPDVYVKLAATITTGESDIPEWCSRCYSKMGKLSHVCPVCNTSHR